jgi:hypothetical protein
VEEIGSKPPRLDQSHGSLDEAGNDDSREARAGSNVRPRRSCVWFETHELGGIQDVPVPELVERRRGDQILSGRLGAKQPDISFELLECFT